MDNSEKMRRAGVRVMEPSVIYSSPQPKSSSNDAQAEANKAHADLLRKNASALTNPSASSDSMNIFSSMSPGTFQNHPQQTVEAFRGLRPNENIVMMDFETLGTYTNPSQTPGMRSMKWYSPTEIAFSHQKVTENMNMENQGRNMSLLLQPSSEAHDELQSLITRVKGGDKSLTQDERRAMADMTLYGFDDPFGKEGGLKRVGEATYINSQNRDARPMGDSIFGAQQIDAAQKGLDNLWDNGTKPDEAVRRISEYLQETGEYKLGGYNIDQFDSPLFQDYIQNTLGNHVEGGSKDQKALETLRRTAGNMKNIDVLSGMKALYKDPRKEFGATMKQEDVAKRNLGSDRSFHLAADDVQASADIYNDLINNRGLKDVLNQNTPRPARTASFNDRPLQTGDRMFAEAGVAPHAKGQFDGVYQKDPDTGEFRLAHDMGNQVPLYKNTSYRIEGMYKDQEMADGTKQQGMMLYNEDDDLYHYMARNTEGELQDTIQQTLSREEDVDARDRALGKESTMKDRYRRRYAKLFGGDPQQGTSPMRQFMGGLEALEEHQAAGLGGVDLEQAVRNDERFKSFNGKEATPQQYRDLLGMQPRLAAEKDPINDTLDHLDKSNLGKDNSYQGRSAQGMVLSNLRQELDATYGKNEMNVTTPGDLVKLDIEGKETPLRLGDTTSVEKQIRRISKQGHLPGMAVGATRDRLGEVVNQLEGNYALTSEQAEGFRGEIQGLKSKDSPYTLIRSMAANVEERHQQGGVYTTQDMVQEEVTRVAKDRQEAMQKNWSSDKDRILNRATERAMPYYFDQSPKNGRIRENPALQRFAQRHDDAMSRYVKGFGNDVRAEPPRSAMDAIEKITSNYMDQGFHVQYMEEPDGKGLSMILGDQDKAEELKHMTPDELKKSNHTAVVGLPTMNEDFGIGTPGGQSRVARIKPEKGYDGRKRITTAFDEAVERLGNSAKTAGKMKDESSMIQVEGSLNRGIRETFNNLSVNKPSISQARQDMDDAMRIKDGDSAAAIWQRQGLVDTTGMAQDWYKEKYGTSINLEPGENILERLNKKERGAYQSEIAEYSRKEYGLKVDYHAVKDAHASQGLLASNDTRSLMPFGAYNAMGRENLQKSANYLPMDEGKLRQNMEGRLGKNRADQLLNTPLVTDKGKEVMGGEQAHLNMRAAYVNDLTLHDRINEDSERGRNVRGLLDKHQIDPASITTYDGMSIMADDVASTIETSRTKNIALPKGTELDPKMEEFMRVHAQARGIENFDPKTMDFPEMDTGIDMDSETADLNIDENRRDGQRKLTVGRLTTDDTTAASYTMQPHKRARFKGWDAKKQKMIMAEDETFRDGNKILTRAGERSTVRTMPREIMEAMGLDADIAMEPAKISRDQHGVELDKIATMMVDDALQQTQDKRTVGGLVREEALAEIQNILNRNLGTTDKDWRVEDQQLVMNERFGWDNDKTTRDIGVDQVNHMIGEAEEFLGTKFTDDGVSYGQTQVGLHNVHNWHNEIGANDGEGLVRFGPKERDFAGQRMRKHLGGGSNLVDWMENRLGNVAKQQNKGIEDKTRGLSRVIMGAGEEAPREGDVVVKTRGADFDGARVGENGEIELNRQELDDIPNRTQKGQMFTTGDYSKTILGIGENETSIAGGTGGTVGDAVNRQDRSYLMEMPDEGFTRKYVRFLDETIQTDGGTQAVPNELQQRQQAIFRKAQEYSEAGKKKDYTPKQMEDLKHSINRDIGEYEREVSRQFGSSGSGTVTEKAQTAKLSSSGRFNIQGVNPFEQGGKGYQENTAYVGRDRAKSMIKGIEGKLGDIYGIQGRQEMTQGQLSEKILEQMNEKGLYGMDNRYPTIHENTISPTRVMIDETMDADDRNTKMTATSAALEKADFDGDFKNIVLQQYQEDDAAKLHQEMGQYWQGVKGETEAFAKETFLPELRTEMEKGTTIGEAIKNPDFREKFPEMFRVRDDHFTDKESQLARTGKEKVGPMDNMRQRLHNAAQPTMEAVRGQQGFSDAEITRKQDVLDNFGQIGSQDSISAKKIQAGAIRDEIETGWTSEGRSYNTADLDTEVNRRMDERMAAIDEFQKGVLNPTDEGVRRIRGANEVLSLFSEQEDRVSGQNFRFDEMLGTLQEQHQLHGGTKNWLNTDSLTAGTSGAQTDIGKLSNTLDGRSGELFTPTRFWDDMADTSPAVGERVSTMRAQFEETVQENRRRMQESTGESRVDYDSFLSDRGQQSAARMEQPSRTASDGMKRSLSGALGKVGIEPENARAMTGAGIVGAAAFGATWAGSAMMRGNTKEPTPEELNEQVEQGATAGAPNSAQPQGQTPTARVAPKGENVQIDVNASAIDNMNDEDIASMVQQEMNSMMGTSMEMNLNVNDNTQVMDRKWMEERVNQAIDSGFAY